MGFHGDDEHLTIDHRNMGCELIFEIVSACAHKRGS